MKMREIIENMIQLEGGYINDPDDSGGSTKYGITQKVANAHGFKKDISKLPREKAISIYFLTYWKKPNFNIIFSISEKIALRLFDIGVNIGTGTASKWLQRVINLLLETDIKVDGKIGDITLEALEKIIYQRGKENAEKVIVKLMESLQAYHYIFISEKWPKNKKYIYGWIMNRLVNKSNN